MERTQPLLKSWSVYKRWTEKKGKLLVQGRFMQFVRKKNGLRGLFENGVLCTRLEDTMTEYSEKRFPLMYYEGNILILL